MGRGWAVAVVAGLLTASAQASDIARSIEPTGDPRLDGILASQTWAARDFTFSFPEREFSQQPPDVGFMPLSEEQKQIVRAVFNSLEIFAQLRFLEEPNADKATLTFARWNQASSLGQVDAKAKGGGDAEWTDVPGQTWISEPDSLRTDASLGGRPSHWFMHEIGHILGLEHAHSSHQGRAVPAEWDNQSHTIMTYRLSREIHLTFPIGRVFPTTYMPLDIFALQHLYGPNWETESGDTRYKFSPGSGDYFAGGKGITGNPDGKLLLTLWDGGGADTLDFTAYAEGGFYDMRPGGFSTPDRSQLIEFQEGEFAQGCIALPLLPKGDRKALFENIIVGNGSNSIVANEADNNIVLGSGANVVVFHPGNGRDLLMNFGPDDIIDLSGYRIPEELIHVTADGQDTIITVDQWPKDQIRVVNGVVSMRTVRF